MSHYGRVACPRHEHAVALERCASCPERVGTELGSDGRPEALRCFPPETPRAREVRYATFPVYAAGDVMTRDLLCVQPDLSLDSLIDLFTQQGFKAVPVANFEGKLVGVVTASELLQEQGQDAIVAPRDTSPALTEANLGLRAESRCVADVMSPLVFEVRESTPITQVAGLMAFEGIHHVVVRGSDGRITGMIGASDVLQWVARSDGYAVDPPRHWHPRA